MKTHRSLVAPLLLAALASCSVFEEKDLVDITGFTPDVSIKFFNFGVSSPGVNFYADAIKMTAISSSTGAESTTGVAYGAAGSGGLYIGVEPGQHVFSGKIAASTDKDLAISNVTATIEAGKKYSFFQSGIYNTTAKTVDAFVVEDVIPTSQDFTMAHVRFVHAVSNGNPMTLYARNTTTTTETAVGAEIAYKGAGAFIELPEGVYDLNTRNTGSATNVISRTGLSFVGGRVYTITARGDINTASTRALDNTTNR